MRSPVRWALTASALLSISLVSSARAGALPVVYNGVTGYLGHISAFASPPGANNWSCRPSASHPRPVILVHGTFADMSDSWQALSPLLRDNGYCVFALNYGSYAGAGSLGIYGTGDIAASAAQLGGFVDSVLAATGSAQVDIVGHSQGGMMPRYYLRFLGGAPKVHNLVALAPSNHGTTGNGLLTLAGFFPGADAFLDLLCPACAEQIRGSMFLNKLNAGADTVPGPRYTVIESVYDEDVTPYTSALLDGANATNVLLQNQCRLDLGEHLSMPYDHVADRDVLNALDPAHAVAPACTPVYPVVGG